MGEAVNKQNHNKMTITIITIEDTIANPLQRENIQFKFSLVA